MTENTFAALIFSMVGVLYIGLGIPLLLDAFRQRSMVVEQRKLSQMKESGTQ